MKRVAREAGRLRTRATTPVARHAMLSTRATLQRSVPDATYLSRMPQRINLRSFSSEAAATATAIKPEAKKEDSHLFFDNLGKIFLTVIAAIVGTLIRSSYNTSNRNLVRDHLEDISALDPVEIEELRLANSELKPEVFRTIMKAVSDRFPHGSCSYHEFIHEVRRTMIGLKGGAFTIELGHLMDRVVTKILERHQKSADEPLPMGLWFATLSLALNSSAGDRIRILYEVMEMQDTPVMASNIPEMVEYLQDTCQLPCDSQIVPTDTKYPTQQYEQGTPKDLVPWDGDDRDLMDIDAFASILRSKSVCAWGECYHKKKFDGVDS
jgi:hypothetical protein